MRVRDENIFAVATQVMKGAQERRYSLESWSEHVLHPSHPVEATVDWVFVLDCLNFSFWSDSDVLYAGARYVCAL